MLFVAPSRCKPARSSATPAFRLNVALSFGVGIHVGDVFEESDGDLMGDGVNIAARLEAIAEPGGICLSKDAYRQARDRLKEEFTDLGEKELKNITRPVRAYAVKTRAGAMPPPHAVATERPSPRRLSIVVLPSDWAERKKQNPPEPFRGSSE